MGAAAAAVFNPKSSGVSLLSKTGSGRSGSGSKLELWGRWRVTFRLAEEHVNQTCKQEKRSSYLQDLQVLSRITSDPKECVDKIVSPWVTCSPPYSKASSARKR